MDKELLRLAKAHAEALVAYYKTPLGNANRVPQERKDALKAIQLAERQLDNRAAELARGA